MSRLENKAIAIVQAINEFEAECEAASYTDTGEAWALLDDIRYGLQEELARPSMCWWCFTFFILGVAALALFWLWIFLQVVSS